MKSHCLQGCVTPGARSLPKVNRAVSLGGRDLAARAGFLWEQVKQQGHHQAGLTLQHSLHSSGCYQPDGVTDS